MITYSERTGLEPDFEVSYRLLPHDEGGRVSVPNQHIRWDFLYSGDDPQIQGVNMIWPEFMDANRRTLPEGKILEEGFALMFVCSPEQRPRHYARIKVGIRGYMVEGPRKVADCTVTRILSLHENPSS